MKKVLLLGGTYNQVHSIITSKKLGHYTITCDNNPNNPGHEFADEYYQISALDKDGVLELAKKLKIDGIVCYAADTPLVTAAYVAEKMGIPGLPLKYVEILTHKDLFRKFLKDNGFNTPKAKGYYSSEINQAINDWDLFKKPIMVKPVDASGSKGVCKIEKKEDLENTIKYSLSFSRNNRFIIEEYVEKNGYQINGDGFSINGKLVFRCFSNEHFNINNGNTLVPIGTSVPYDKPKIYHDKIHNEIQKLISCTEIMTAAYNFDMRLDNQDNIFLMEVTPRSAGSMYPQVVEYATGINLAEYTIKAALNEDCSNIKMVEPKGFWAWASINSKKSGILKNINILNELEKNIVEKHIFVQLNTQIEECVNSNGTLGIMILKFDSVDEMFFKMNNIDKYVNIVLD